MGALDRNPYWHRMCRRMPWGAWLIGPGTRSVIAAALEDAAAHRRNLDSDNCNGCPTPADIADLETLGFKQPPLCPDHQLDADAVTEYQALLNLIGVKAAELARLQETQARAAARKERHAQR